ncbi:MAG TPA: sensor domain-containing diguanylate cyclase [Burkholderiaceae bacterium]
MTTDFEQMFELAPVSLWLEDYSALHALFATWRAVGVTDLRSHLHADRARVTECSRCLKVVQVNRRTLTLFGADDTAHLVANLDKVFRDAMLEPHIEELVALWEGKLAFASQTVNYSLAGQRLDILVNGTVLPGHADDWSRVLVAIEDITERTRAETRVVQSERYARGLFEDSPVSLWVEDFSAIKRLLDDLRARGIEDFRVFTQVHPEFVTRCMQEIRVIDVNRRTLEMFHAPDKATLLRHLDEVFRDEMQAPFAEQLIDLWHGKLMQHREVVNYRLDGELINVLLQFSVLPGAERDWNLVQVALIDITARKKAEAYLEYLGKHDVLTQLRNRAFFEDELQRLERKGPWPVTIVAIDLNRLKATNDQSGHAAGDALLRRAGEVLGKVADKPACAARIGGDEFVLLLPGEDERAGVAMIARVQSLVDLNNQYYPGAMLSLAMGCATAQAGERLEATMSRADERMFAAKRDFYTQSGMDRRTRPAPLND